jgi:hypothetical protein
VRLSKKEQIVQRRAKVLELSSQGLTQQEISERLGPFHISQRTVSRDLEWLDKHSIEYVKKNRQQMAIEYQKAMTSFYHLKKKAWERFNKAEKDGNDELMIKYGNIIIETTNDTMNYMSIGNMIDAELIKHAKQQAAEISEKMKKLQDDKILSSQAKF